MSAPDHQQARSARQRVRSFCERFGLAIPILQAPMAGACPISLAAAVANAGGMSGMGAVLTEPVPSEAADATPPDFSMQCAALLEARPAAASSIMGLFPTAFVDELKARGIAWFAWATTLAEAWAAEAAGVEVIVARE